MRGRAGRKAPGPEPVAGPEVAVVRFAATVREAVRLGRAVEQLGFLASYYALGTWTDEYHRERRLAGPLGQGCPVTTFRHGVAHVVWRRGATGRMTPVEGQARVRVVGTVTQYGRRGPGADAAARLLERARVKDVALFPGD